MPTIKVTGYLEIEDDEFDSGPRGPLTAAADESMRGFGEKPSPRLSSLDDLEFEEDDR